MNRIPGFAIPCRDMCQRYFYFDGWLPDTVLAMNVSPFCRDEREEALRELQQKIGQAFLDSDRMAFRKNLDPYFKEVACSADGHPDTAVYLLLLCHHMVQDKLERTGVNQDERHTFLLEKARNAADYRALTEMFQRELDIQYDALSSKVKKESQKDILKVIAYIDNHYKENLTLEVLARHIHMNTFYFSSYFKKHMGLNFKDYLNKIRIQHAVTLLITTDKRSYEIAEEIGFKDTRYFNEVFSRIYGKTPTAYRREFLNGRQTLNRDTGGK